MGTKNTTTKNLAYLLLVVVLLPFSVARAQDAGDQYDSLHQANALESQISFADIQNRGTVSVSVQSDADVENDPADSAALQLHNITAKGNYSVQAIDAAMNDLGNRNKMQTFLIGTSLGTLKFQTVQLGDQISILNALLGKTDDASIKIQIDNQIQFLKQEQIKVENFVLAQENKFSLFGWFVKIL